MNDLADPEELRNACDALGGAEGWSRERTDWVDALAGVLEWVRQASPEERTTREFQHRLWEENRVAAVGQGDIPIDVALDDPQFREWVSRKSLEPLPTTWEGRLVFLSDFFQGLQERLEPHVTRTPRLKIFRVLAALYPEAMTTVGSAGALQELVRAMGGERGLTPVARHLWVRERLDAVIGPAAPESRSLAERMSLAWMLYDRFVKSPEVLPPPPPPDKKFNLAPLPAARRRRGLTPIRGAFQGALSTLEYVRDGVTRQELLDFLRTASPGAKDSSLSTMVNVLQSELGVVRVDGDKYILTERGVDVLESQDPTDLAEWLLTRILGLDKAIVELRDRGPLSPPELIAAVRTANPYWTTTFVPQAIVGWLRSMGVVTTTADNKHALTDLGQRWAAMIHWVPELLAPLEEPSGPVVRPVTPGVDVWAGLPPVTGLIASISQEGYFPPALVAKLHASLWSHKRRHFAILTGLSGSGKTLLARAYARAISVDPDTQLFTLAVQPGWYDPGALLGFTNPLRGDSYVRTPFLEFLLLAAGDPTRPYIVVLDEMNLSHPEQYMAPLLSAMETGAAIDLHTEDELFDGVPASVPYPSNLVLIGTVNMDETTHGLSDKILDRAFVLEFWTVDLNAYPRWGTRATIGGDEEKRVRELLEALMKALDPVRLHFGWRVVDDVLNFMGHAGDSDGHLPFDDALDNVVYSKILPKLRGEDSPRFRDALAGCSEALKRFGLETSRAKVEELARDLASTGSARFWR